MPEHIPANKLGEVKSKDRDAALKGYGIMLVSEDERKSNKKRGKTYAILTKMKK